MKRRKSILIIGAALCLLAVLITLGTCGGGQLRVEQYSPSFVLGYPADTADDLYSARPGLRAGPVTVIADTPWGILISCHISDHVMAQWYTLEGGTTGPFEVTKAEDTETRWFFLKPGESMKVLLDDKWRTDDGTFWTFTNIQESDHG